MPPIWSRWTTAEWVANIADKARRKKLLASMSTEQANQLLRDYKLATRELLVEREDGVRSPLDLAKKAGSRWASFYESRHTQLISAAAAQAIRTGENLIVLCPPRHGKSTIVSQWTPFYYLTDSPEEEVIFAAYGEGYAKKWGGRVRQLVLENGREQGLFLDAKQTRVTEWKLTKGGGMTSVGVGSGLPGRGTKLFIGDDLVKDAAAAGSPAMRETLWEWWEQTAFPRVEPGGTIILIGTRYHEDDILGRLIKRSEEGELPHFRVLRLPAICDSDDDPLGSAIGEGLWLDPISRYSQKWYDDQKKSISSYGWSAVYQQSPSPEGGGKVKRDWWRFFKPSQLPPQMSQECQSWDLKLKDLDTGSFTCGGVVQRFEALMFVREGFHERGPDKGSIVHVISQILIWQRRYPQALAKLIEAKASGPALQQLLRGKVGGIIGIEPKGSKEARLDAVIPYIQAGQVLLPMTEEGHIPAWVDELIEEFAQFPTGANDDWVDMLTQALSFVGPGSMALLDQLQREALEQDGYHGETVIDVHKNRVFSGLRELMKDQVALLSEGQDLDALDSAVLDSSLEGPWSGGQW